MLNKQESAVGEAVCRTEREDWIRPLARLVLGAFLGLLSAHATVYGSTAPFGVGAAAAAVGPGAFLIYLATAVGYLLPGNAGSPIHYISAVAMAGGLRWVFGGLGGIGGRAWFSPIVAFFAVLSTGIAVNLVGGFHWYWLMVTVCESALAAGYAVAFSETSACLLNRDSRAAVPLRQMALTVVGAVVLMSVSRLEIVGISPGRILASVFVLLFARINRESGGAMAGTVLGVAMMLVSGNGIVAAAYALGGLLAGWLMRYGRLAAATVFFAVGIVASVQETALNPLLIHAYEALTAAVLFLVIPPSWERELSRWFLGAEEHPESDSLRRSLVRRLTAAGQALREVAGTVDSVSGKLSAISTPDVGSVFRSVSDTTCKTCGLKHTCWITEERKTVDSLQKLLPALRTRGEVSTRDFPPEFLARCARIDRLSRDISREYRDFCTRETAFRRIGEIRSVVTEQFFGMSDLLSELSDRFSDGLVVDTAAAERLASVCRDYGLSPTEVICLLDGHGRMTVDILLPDTVARVDKGNWAHDLSVACGRPLTPPTFSHTAEFTHVTLSERPQYRFKIARSQLACDGERLCGDAAVWAEEGGMLTAVLSDGMGSGGRAAVDSAMAATLTTRLFRAGFGEKSVLGMVNAALMTKSEEESLSTLDVLRLDAYNGHLTLLKAGATFSYLLSGGRLSRFDRASLPAGILSDIAFEKQEDTLAEGDLLLMVSDGVLCGETAWLEERLLSWCDFPHSLQAFCDEIALTAREKQPKGHEDDITVLAVLVDRRE